MLAMTLTMAVTLWLTGCAALPDKVDRPVTHALANPESTRLGALVQARANKTGTRNDSAFALVGDAELAFTSRMTLIKAAQKTLDIQYYAIFQDDTTERMLEAMREAAARGVRIRILLDDFNATGKNTQVLKLAFEKNIALRLFNPLPGGRSSLMLRILANLKDTARIQRRMHNKIFVADNAVAIVGGRNLGETYFGRGTDTNFVDIDVLASGRIARDLSRSFDQYWNNPLAYPVQSLMSLQDIESFKPQSTAASTGTPDSAAPAAEAVSSTAASAADEKVASLPRLPDDTDLDLLAWTWAPSVLLADKPSKIAADADATEEAQDTTVDGLLSLMAQAKGDLLIVSPYFVPGTRMMKQFADLRARNVRVRVLTNSLASNDAPAAHVGYAKYRKALLALGVELYEMHAEQPGTFSSFGVSALAGGSGGGGSRASLHSKVVVMDNRLLVVGSMNLDLRSQLQNSEVAIVIRNRTISLEATRLIEPTLRAGAYRVQLVDGQLVWRAPQGSTFTDTTSEPDASMGLKLITWLIAPFAPEEML
jgi:phosphatidylserine/phosphatidylglycerophosphate/cardiolipin synthase-like enzyme